ncbi:MAG: DNA repair protein RecO [bacterium]|nr:DNA repair protein RecO [bacterium]
MKYFRSEAIVLSAKRWSESSLILQAYSASRGKVSLVSKGARRPKSYNGAEHRPGSHIEAIWIERGKSDLYPLVAIDPLSYIRVPELWDGYRYAMQTLKLTKQTLRGEQSHPAGFQQLLRTMRSFRHAQQPELLYWQFCLRWVVELGFALDSVHCARCGNTVTGKHAEFFVQIGGFWCDKCCRNSKRTESDLGFPVTGETVAVIRRLESLPEEKAHRIKVSDQSRLEIERLLQLYIGMHLEVNNKL